MKGHQRNARLKPARNLGGSQEERGGVEVLSCDCLRWFEPLSPAVEAAVDDGVVYGGAHGQPQHRQVNLLDVLLLAQLPVEPHHDEVHMIGQPAEGKGQHHNDHHLHYLTEGGRKLDIHSELF